jgi:hypothetical protein
MTNPWSKIKEFVHENDGNTDATLSLSMDELQWLIQEHMENRSLKQVIEKKSDEKRLDKIRYRRPL